MNIKSRIKKIEQAMRPTDDPIAGARSLANLYFSTGGKGDLEEITANFVREGFTLKKVLDDIADAGPPPPRGDQEGYLKWQLDSLS